MAGGKGDAVGEDEFTQAMARLARRKRRERLLRLMPLFVGVALLLLYAFLVWRYAWWGAGIGLVPAGLAGIVWGALAWITFAGSG